MTAIHLPFALYVALTVTAGAVVLLLLAGFFYQWIGGVVDRVRLCGEGRLVDIGQRRHLYIVERGPAGRGPTVVFESGFGATSLNWIHIQEALAAHVHTVAYDRCGLGWSSACVSERTPTQVAAELRSLLLAAGIEPPWIMVGHSYGGLVARRFALDYPDETAGALLLDPMRTEEWLPMNTDAHEHIARAQRMTRIGEGLAHLGLTRLAARSHFCRSARLSGFLIDLAGSKGEHLADRLNTEIGKMPPEIRPSIAAHWSTPRFYRGLLAHLRAVSATVTEMHGAAPIQDTPVVVVTPASATPVPDMEKFGTCSREVIAEQSQHWIHLDEPKLVVQMILDIVEQVGSQEQSEPIPVLACVR